MDKPQPGKSQLETPQAEAPESKTPVPKKQAAALRYSSAKERAPRLLAKGQGELAERIIARAREHGVPVYEDSALVGTLMQLELETEIPPELYRVVASVLAFVYRLDRRYS